MDVTGDTDFYATYGRFKDYATPNLGAKQIARFDAEFWRPAGCAPAMSVLEIGCSTGLFLAYLAAKGVGDFIGIDHDGEVVGYLPEAVAANFRRAEALDFLETGAEGRRFDRVAMFDVLEHFPPAEGARLLRLVAGVLKPGGKVVIKVPNMASPWGAKYQFGDLTHRAAYTPESLRQLALACGYAGAECYPHLEGSPVRRLTDGLVHGLLSRLLASPPELWSANFFALLEQAE